VTSNFASNWLDIDKIQKRLNSKIIGNHILGYDAVSSTNSVLRELAFEGKPEGAVVVAQTQRAGYGRLNRTWFSPRGGLWFSIILRPKIAPSKAAKITLMTGVAIAKTLLDNYNLNARIKWPNDVLIGGKKICGILTEMRIKESEIDYILLGIGINGNFELLEIPDEIRKSTTTLKHEKKGDIDLENLFLNLLVNLDYFYHQLQLGNSKEILIKWKGFSDTLGRKVMIKTHHERFEGKALDLDESGALILEIPSGERQKIFAGDCIHLKAVEGED
jgi:BirA family biotin operon repressor/biotin-[acetyl-CoA-carboxylase] ligase